MKKILAVIMSLSMLLAATACSNDSNSSKSESKSDSQNSGGTSNTGSDEYQLKESASLKVWASQEDQEIVKEMVESFKKKYPDTTWNIEFGVVSEADAKSEVLKDTEAAADVFAFASDQLGELQSAGALYKITKNKDRIIADNIDASINASKVGDDLYAYPSSSDTYFMYYDKKYLSDEDVKSLETILSKNLGGDVVNFSFDMDNGWYNAGFFFAAGAKLFGDDGTDPTKCDFNNDKGLLAAKYLISLANNSKFKLTEDDITKADFADRKLGATISGSWNAEDIKKSLGDDFGVTKLPTITFEDGTTTNLGSMANFKLIGINSQTKSPMEAMALADYLTSYECQKIRFEKRSFAPTNKELAGDKDALSSNPVVAAAAEQAQYATLQSTIPQMGNFWTPAEAFGAAIVNKEITVDNVQERLDKLVESILSTLT